MSASDVIELDHRFELFIPTQCVCGKNIEDQLRIETLDLVKGKFHDWFGGATVKPVNGIWRLPDGTIADEKVDIVDSLAGEDSFDDYLDEAKRLAVSIADKLSQDRVLLKINETGFLFARSDDQAKCSHKTKTASADDRPVIDVPKDDPILIYYALSNFSSLRDARHLFCNVLNYMMVTADLPIGNWPQSTKVLLKEIPEVLADTNGFRIVHIRLAADRLLRGSERQIIQRIFQDDPTFRGLFVVSDANLKNWEFVNVKTQGEKSDRLILRRMKVGTDAVRTATERIIRVQIKENEERTISAADLQVRHDEAFDVEAVTKQFYRELSDWYFWALTLVEYPDDIEKNAEVRNAENVIRLITRLIFVWFLMEKGLVPATLFNKKDLETLIDFGKDKTGSAYYRAILQNLFFATLNVPMSEREFRVEKRYKEKNKDYMNHLVFRYSNLFLREDSFKDLFGEIPFLNGGLFECMDFLIDGKQMRIDCFSDNPANVARLKVPDELFFGNAVVDLSEVYGDKKKKSVKVRGIVDILNSYNFTLEENTPLEEEIALDPELLGRVFENLLASYNPETKTTARKQTGSFYTPRVIVNYMVDESLKAYLTSNLGENKETRKKLEQLLAYDGPSEWTDKQKQQIIDALEDVKILDPACGSGAFPMGVLQKMVHILEKLDPGNEKWKKTLIKRSPTEIRKETERMLETNSADYIRKLGIIQNCIYGVDIQPIAIQVSQLRFFISLLVDFTVDKNEENFGIQPMPNLDYKFMQGNSLIEDFHGFTLNMREEKTSKGALSLFSENKEVERLIADLWEKQGSFMRETRPMEKDRLREEVEQDIINIFDTYIRQKKAPYFAGLHRIEDMSARIPNQKQREKYLTAEKGKLDRKHNFDYLSMERELKELTHGYKPRNFFPWQLYFAEVFKKKGGFDIVIGNPPYGVSIKGVYRTNVVNCLGKVPDYEIYYYFIELSYNTLKNNGSVTYIIPNTFLFNVFAEKYRLNILNTWKVREILDCTNINIFESATVRNAIISFSKTTHKLFGYKNTANAESFVELASRKLIVDNSERFKKNIKNWGLIFKLDKNVLDLVDKIQDGKTNLIEIFPEISQGLISYDKYQGQPAEIIKERAYHYTKKSKQGLKKWLWGEDVNRYSVKWNGKEYIDYCDGIANPRDPKFFKGSRILVREITNPSIYAAYTNKELYNDPAIIIVKANKNMSIKALLAILNSKLATFYHFNSSPKASKGVFPKILVNDIKQFPMPEISRKIQSQIESLTNKIIDKRSKNESILQYENQVDSLVYKLYGLINEEIDIIEKT